MKRETHRAIKDFWLGVKAKRYDINEKFQTARLAVIDDNSIPINNDSDTEMLNRLLNDNSSRNGVENER